MKSFTALLIGLAFCAVAATPAWADNPTVNGLDRYSVWTQWYDAEGKRMENPVKPMHAGQDARLAPISTGFSEQNTQNGNGRVFDFIKETKKYDYEQDRANKA